MDLSLLKWQKMETYHITEVCELQEEIKQFHADNLTTEAKRELIRRFILWDREDLADCQVLENPDGSVAAYYILLLDKSNIELFYTENDDEVMKNIAYLAQIVVSRQLRGSGTGLKVMEAIQKSCQSAQKKRLILEVNSRANAFAWYLNQGFTEIGAQVFLEKKLP